MGSTSSGGGGIDFQPSPEQRSRDSTSEQWSSALSDVVETFGAGSKEARQFSQWAENMAATAPKSCGGYDIGDLSLAPEFASMAGSGPALGSAERYNIGDLSLSREPLTALGARTIQPSGFAVDPEAMSQRVHEQVSQFLPLAGEGISTQKPAPGEAANMARIGTEFGIMAAHESPAATGNAGGGGGGGGGGIGSALGSALAGGLIGGAASAILTPLLHPIDAIDSAMARGEARHGSAPSVMNAAMLSRMEGWGGIGQGFGDWLHRQAMGDGGAPNDRLHRMKAAAQGALFGPKQGHN